MVRCMPGCCDYFKRPASPLDKLSFVKGLIDDKGGVARGIERIDFSLI